MRSWPPGPNGRAVFSLNVPVPGKVERIAADLHPALVGFDDVRERHTLVLKRLDAGVHHGTLESAARRALAGAPAVEARIAGIDAFREPVSGPGPVCYLAVESPGLHRLHRQLVDALGAVDGLEGEAYVPHVTLARGGPPEAVERLLARPVEPVTWTVRELELYDARHRERVSALSLPA